MIGRLVVVGLGLIGGSFAKGLRESGICREVVGVDLDPNRASWRLCGGSLRRRPAAGVRAPT
jgi:prephenate dehydrogenase